MSKVKAEYIWMDGHEPTQKLRSKTKVIDGPINSIDDLPLWGFDGSSTNQAVGNDSDCMLKPVGVVHLGLWVLTGRSYRSAGMLQKHVLA